MTLKEKIEAKRKAAAEATTKGEQPSPPLAEPARPKMLAKASISQELSYQEQQLLSRTLSPTEKILDASGKIFERKLNETSQIGDVPYMFPSQKDSPIVKQWTAAICSESSNLGIWIDPDSQNAWIAVEISESPGTLALLHKLPLFSRTHGENPF